MIGEPSVGKLEDVGTTAAVTIFVFTLFDCMLFEQWRIGVIWSCTAILLKLCSCKNKTRNFTYCSDFRYESNGIFVLGVGFFFFRQISTF